MMSYDGPMLLAALERERERERESTGTLEARLRRQEEQAAAASDCSIGAIPEEQDPLLLLHELFCKSASASFSQSVISREDCVQ
ncbi:hypothetical protein GQ55_2G049900 [Panicum hallii var. hallii]|uniref:Uncharacterized protein n=1 Tax=Panicum hallii var. hallii TaxID=1504633 RepID=A0A2T7ELJ1_9POAL|nr:hypothetical protein GQ55_2G049900 [Panicum hallii var. hallii]